ncbi:structural cement protein Gp24 [Swingsia samuiensis]|uniref:DUF2190 family protein n=1 Tax=Swingsia samuiensis TaxID=1293412 RepID=A0A4Y6ULZ6_9PROT|nr:hypothetical protein [Swingsia samuiensis]QDH17416.1 hypothetical protein E3D00_07435 [Swingsia samuiensis]
MSFQSQINYNWPVGFPGDVASANPTRTAIAGALGHRAGAGGVTIGNFAWAQSDGVTVLNKPDPSNASASPTGFVIRDNSAIIAGFNQGSTMTMNPGFMVTLKTGGDFFALVSADTITGQGVFASTTDGSIKTAPVGSPPDGTVATGWVVAKGAPAGQVSIISGPLAPISFAATPQLNK